MSDQQWHYTNKGQQFAPVSSEALKELAASGELTPTDMIWKEGMANWVRASALEGLFTQAAPIAVAALETAPTPEPEIAPSPPVPDVKPAGDDPPAEPVKVNLVALLQAPPLVWALRSTLLLLFISTMFSWFSLNLRVGSNGNSLRELPLGSTSLFGSQTGGGVALAIFISLLAAGGVVVSFLESRIPFAGLIVAVAGFVAFILVICAMLFVGPSSERLKLLNLSMSLTWGAWLALVLGLASVTLSVLAYGNAFGKSQRLL